MISDATVTLDVRPDIQAGRDPLARILETVAVLKGEERLRLVAPFEPVPLYRRLALEGFSHESRSMASGVWEVLFSRSPAAAPAPEVTPAGSPSPLDCSPMLEVDARGLEPPKPLVVILEAIGRLTGGAALRARTDRRPLHLYPQLTERGFTGVTEEQHDGSFVTTIRHAGQPANKRL